MKKVALVTGSSRGIGRAEAKRLAREGYAVCINYIESKDAAEQLLSELRSQGLEAMAYQADVADREAVFAMVRAVEDAFGPVTLLVNNAGIAQQHQFQDITPEYWKRIFDVNLGGAFNTIQAVLPNMLHEHASCIINTASIFGLHGASCESDYAATKHAVAGLTKSLAAELGPSGIRVNAVAPGCIDTDMIAPLGRETLDGLAESTPLNRLGNPEDIANLVAFLASDAASFITGQIVAADGGFINI
jgi:3-oxoacyl-[acyl-carrier protein] reductase